LDGVSFIGLGVVGLTTQICFATRGIKTIGIDVNEQKLKNLQHGKVPFYEPQLYELFNTVRSQLLFSSDLRYAIESSRFIFITVGTSANSDGHIDLSQVTNICKRIGKELADKSDYIDIVIKSTVVPTTTNNVIRRIIEQESKKLAGRDFGLIVNPEFLREGSAVDDTLNPNFLLIGYPDDTNRNFAGKEIEKLWRTFFNGHTPQIVRTNWVTAELIKYSINAFLATKVSFINSIANVCQRLAGSDIEHVAQVIGMDPRIGSLYLKAGPGYGGSCIPKDVKALIKISQSIGYDFDLLKTVDKINENQYWRIIELTKDALHELQGKTIAILGVAFKKNTDDIREAASVRIIENLLNCGVKVIATDPMALGNLKKIFGDRIRYTNDKFRSLSNADCCIVLTDWEDYKKMKPKDFINYMRRACIVDARRIFDPSEFGDKTEYFAIGLKPQRRNEVK
jgi:UDPglucose 6-dehydrogenase